MKRRLIAVIIAVIFLPVISFAEISIKAEVDKSKITTDEQLTYKVVITSNEKQVPPLNIPQFTGFRVLSTANSSTMTFVKNQVKTFLAYVFILAPAELGKLKIEPSYLKTKDDILPTKSFEIEVVQGQTRLEPLPKPEEKSPLPKKDIFPAPDSKQPQITL